MQTQTINIALPKDLIKETDELAREEYRNRSELIREALRKYIKSRQSWQRIFKQGRRAAKKLGIKSEAEIDKIVYDFRHGK